jgi:hypothetical protein
MPHYRDKQRLKAIIANGKELNSLTRYLILQGSSYEEASKGLEPYVSWWEQSVQYIEASSVSFRGYSEEYDHDLWPRSQLYEVLKYAPEEELNRCRERIEQADAAFKDVTIEGDIPSCHLENPEKKEHWWLFRSRKD